MKKTISLVLVLVMAFVPMTIAVSATASYPDVKENAWYYKEVTEMSNRGYIKGYKDGTFKPYGTITYAEFITIVTRCVGLNNDGDSSWPYVNHWAEDAVSMAYAAKWFDWDECPPEVAQYNRPIPRQIATKIIMRAFAEKELPTYQSGDYYSVYSKTIADFSSINGRYYTEIYAAYDNGIVVGDNNGNFNPNSGLNRAEASKIIYRALQKFPDVAVDPIPEDPNKPDVDPVSGGVSENGQLSVKGTQLVNKDGKPIILRGMSSHGINWFPEFTTKASIKKTRDAGANLFRVAMYTEEYNGYIANNGVKKDVIKVVDAAIELDMYVIIDWHILQDGNPQKHTEASKKFFAEMSQKYKDKPNVLYEICNEPNGNVSWKNDIKPYAEKVIPEIRKNAPKSIVLVGTPTWSQDVDHVVNNKLSFDNIMYSLHFYAGTHGDSLRAKAKAALKGGVPLFVTEWGTSSADGSGGVYIDASKTWLKFLNDNNISWANWSLCDKNETSAALKPNSSSNWTTNNLSESGKFIFSRFKG